jgi:hypothetical protein
MRKKFEDLGPNKQLVVFLVSRVGMRDAIKVMTFIVQWGTVARKLKREPTWPEYCAYWGESRATYFRALRVHRTVWPDDKNPQRIWLWVEDKLPAGLSVPRTVDVLGLVAM